MLCLCCWTFGHTGKRCIAPHRICGRCSKVHPENQVHQRGAIENDAAAAVSTTAGSSDENQGTSKIVCMGLIFHKNCKADDYSVSSRKCPIYLKEIDIHRMRIDNNISYPQTRREYETRKNTQCQRRNLFWCGQREQGRRNRELEEIKKWQKWKPLLEALVLAYA